MDRIYYCLFKYIIFFNLRGGEKSGNTASSNSFYYIIDSLVFSCVSFLIVALAWPIIKVNHNSLLLLTSIFLVALVLCIILHYDLKKRGFVEKITEQYNSFSQQEKERNSLKWGLLAILPMFSFLILCMVFIFIQNHS
jgi:hypothetical protein